MTSQFLTSVDEQDGLRDVIGQILVPDGEEPTVENYPEFESRLLGKSEQRGRSSEGMT